MILEKREEIEEYEENFIFIKVIAIIIIGLFIGLFAFVTIGISRVEAKEIGFFDRGNNNNVLKTTNTSNSLEWLFGTFPFGVQAEPLNTSNLGYYFTIDYNTTANKQYEVEVNFTTNVYGWYSNFCSDWLNGNDIKLGSNSGTNQSVSVDRWTKATCYLTDGKTAVSGVEVDTDLIRAEFSFKGTFTATASAKRVTLQVRNNTDFSSYGTIKGSCRSVGSCGKVGVILQSFKVTPVESASKDIIDNQNQNTQDIINNNNENTNKINENNNKNTDKIIENMMCSSLNIGNDKLTKVGYLNSLGNVVQSNNYYHSDFIYITQNTEYNIKANYNGSGISYCLYNAFQSKISCSQYPNQTSGTDITFNSGSANFIKFSTYKGNPSYEINLTGKVCKTIAEQGEETNDAINKVNDTLNDDSVDDPTSSLNGMENYFGSNGVISDLLLLPVRLFQSIVNSIDGTCSAFNLGSLLGHNLIMPCIDIKSRLGNALFGVIDILISGFFVLSIRKKFVDIWENFTSLKTGGNELE